jgi:hypothetical protein
MNTVTVSRTIPGTPTAVREAMLELEPFTRAAGFDSVDVDGETIHVANQVGIAEIELELAVVDDHEADLAYEQRDGIFEEMWTTFEVTPAEDAREAESVEVVATTQFSLDVALIGDFLDATVISRQRRTELNAQLDYLTDVARS